MPPSPVFRQGAGKEGTAEILSQPYSQNLRGAGDNVHVTREIGINLHGQIHTAQKQSHASVLAVIAERFHPQQASGGPQ